MLLKGLLAIQFTAGICVATSSKSIPSAAISVCQSIDGAAQDPTCWATLGCNTRFDKWKDSCLGAPGCGCEHGQSWSDCFLVQDHDAIKNSTKTIISCVDLEQSDLCRISVRDWTKLSQNKLATAYISNAIGSKLNHGNTKPVRKVKGVSMLMLS